MKIEQKEKPVKPNEREEPPPMVPIDRLVMMTKPIGTFAGREDFIVRMCNGKIVTGDTGDQGGGQN
jgi:hypothetical protein